MANVFFFSYKGCMSSKVISVCLIARLSPLVTCVRMLVQVSLLTM